MWVEETGNSFLAKGWTKLTSCILNNCIFSVVKYFVVSTTLPFIIFLFDKEGKPSKYITLLRNFSSQKYFILHLRSITYYIEKVKGRKGYITFFKAVLQPGTTAKLPPQ